MKENKMKLTTLAIALVCLTAVPALACGNGECDPPTSEPEPEPEKPSVETEKPEGNDLTYDRIYYSVCTCNEMKVAWGFESLELRTNKARMQCEQRRERINCPMKWK